MSACVNVGERLVALNEAESTSFPARNPEKAEEHLTDPFRFHKAYD